MATTTVSPFDYVSTAVSTDEGRYNMTAAYRERDRLIATDGHRLHMVSGLAMQSEGSFVDGRSGQFPNYEAVIPKKPFDIATVTFNKKQIAQLNKVVKLFTDRNCGTRLTFSGNTLTIGAVADKSESQGAWSIVLTFDCEGVDSLKATQWSVGLNLRYFVEALIPNVPMTLSSEDTRGPQLLKATLHGSEYMAIIMPLRDVA